MYYTFQKGVTKVWGGGGRSDCWSAPLLFACFLSSADQHFREINKEYTPSEHRGLYHGFWEKKIYYTIEKCHLSLKQFWSRLGPTFCRSWSRPNCFQRLSADDTRSKELMIISLYSFRVSKVWIQIRTDILREKNILYYRKMSSESQTV